jgi:hypothetical protein
VILGPTDDEDTDTETASTTGSRGSEFGEYNTICTICLYHHDDCECDPVLKLRADQLDAVGLCFRCTKSQKEDCVCTQQNFMDYAVLARAKKRGRPKGSPPVRPDGMTGGVG